MRRLVPWLLLSLVVVGAAVGATLGTAYESSSTAPSQWVGAVLATTEKAGTARFSYTQVTWSPNAELRSSLSGHGVVNFTTGDMRVIEVDHGISFSATGNQPLRPVLSTSTLDAVVVGGTVYQANPIPGMAFTREYHVLPFPKLPRSQRGLSLALDASIALDALHGTFAVASVIDLGPADVDGVATTQYEVEYAPLHICTPHQAPQDLTQRPSRVWLDSVGRLVRVRSTSYSNDRLPRGVKLPAAFEGLPRGPETTVSTLTFSEFGAPVHVTAPPASAVLPGRATADGGAVIRSDVCRS